ncbi:hypothetical protein [Aquimarina atlantica]|uniref:hypothetical protein n=1 Tax=Aquimarina atlantica TaxID=1317122 RepID=UPI0013F43232|nr:hypothetical protein [Aquimarina atlantica]
MNIDKELLSIKINIATLIKMYDAIRNIVPIFTEDVVMYPYVNQVKDFIINNETTEAR